jgi:hypothetical protein
MTRNRIKKLKTLPSNVEIRNYSSRWEDEVIWDAEDTLWNTNYTALYWPN